jgi:lactate dehydrogenase-like 2-hydroxyacid dehydrogenase
VLPHIGSATLQTRNAMGRLAIDNIRAKLSQCPVENASYLASSLQ